MPTRNKSKRMIGFYASPEEKERLLQIADDHEISLSELLRRIAAGDLVVSGPKPERSDRELELRRH